MDTKASIEPALGGVVECWFVPIVCAPFSGGPCAFRVSADEAAWKKPPLDTPVVG